MPLLSGHLGGANALARALAKACGAVPVITTATDVNGLFAVDLWAKAQNCAVLEPERIKRVSGALLAGQTVRYWSPWPVAGETPPAWKRLTHPKPPTSLTLTPQWAGVPPRPPASGVLGWVPPRHDGPAAGRSLCAVLCRVRPQPGGGLRSSQHRPER